MKTIHRWFVLAALTFWILAVAVYGSESRGSQSNQQELSTFAAINPQTTSTDDGQALFMVFLHCKPGKQGVYRA